MQYKVYAADQHNLCIDQIDREALYIMEKLTANGHIAYLVGGGVRDLLLGHKPKDFDISTSAKPEEIKRLFRNCLLIGRRFRLAHIRFGKKIIEVSTFRSGDNNDESLILRDNEWGNAEEDVLRRDFTINGLFYDPAKQEIIDYVGGFEDIQLKQLQTIGKAFIRFKQDPVRMIRLLKFQARFGLTIHPDAKIALLECRGEILKSSQARILEEILRMLESGASAAFIRLMSEHGFLELLTPSFAHFLETIEGKEVYSFLEEIDVKIKEKNIIPQRPILISALLFPMLEDEIKKHFTDREKIPHLGEIFHLCIDLIHDAFKPFFLVPKRLKAIATNILTSQYRLTPLLEKKSQRKLKVPNIIDFHQALEFLELRADIEPALISTLEQWLKATEKKNSPAKKTRRPKKKTEQTEIVDENQNP